jgi:putative ABC transport system substrate-binding protein
VAPRLGLEIHSVEVLGPDAIKPAFTAVLSARAEALILEAEPLLVSFRTPIIQVAATHRLPAVSQHRAFVEAGGLLSYGPDFLQVWRRMATYVDKIVNGTKPGDLPIEQVAHFELVINLKTAKALGLTMPPTLLFQANEVIR